MMKLLPLSVEPERLTWTDFKPHPLRLTKWEREKLKEKLLSNYEVVDGGYDTVCWKWLLSFGGNGYPLLMLQVLQVLQHG
jgi:hypothetical protein